MVLANKMPCSNTIASIQNATYSLHLPECISLTFHRLLIPVGELNKFVAVATMQISFYAFMLVVEDTSNTEVDMMQKQKRALSAFANHSN